jgi:hypothetical protein
MKDPSRLRLENKISLSKCLSELRHFERDILFIRDPGGIQTPNPQSRNLMRYSIAPRGQLFPRGRESF